MDSRSNDGRDRRNYEQRADRAGGRKQNWGSKGRGRSGGGSWGNSSKSERSNYSSGRSFGGKKRFDRDHKQGRPYGKFDNRRDDRNFEDRSESRDRKRFDSRDEGSNWNRKGSEDRNRRISWNDRRDGDNRNGHSWGGDREDKRSWNKNRSTDKRNFSRDDNKGRKRNFDNRWSDSEDRNNRGFDRGERRDDRRGSWNKSRDFDRKPWGNKRNDRHDDRRDVARGEKRWNNNRNDRSWDDRRGENRWEERKERQPRERRWNDRREDRGFDRHDDRRGQKRWNDRRDDQGGEKRWGNKRDNQRGQKRWGDRSGFKNYDRDSRRDDRPNNRSWDREPGKFDRRDEDRRSREDRHEVKRDHRSFREVRNERLNPGLQRSENEPEPLVDFDEKSIPFTVRAELRGLPKDLSEQIQGHIAGAMASIETDMELALGHARAARRLAARLPVIRSIAGEVEYQAGNFDKALSDYRAVLRMTGNQNYLPVIADCERAGGKPEAALRTLRNAKDLDVEQQAEAVLVESGAREDMGQREEAIRVLKNQISSGLGGRYEQARLRYAYANLLELAGQTRQAEEWFTSAAKYDDNNELDTAARISAITGEEIVEEAPEEFEVIDVDFEEEPIYDDNLDDREEEMVQDETSEEDEQPEEYADELEQDEKEKNEPSN